jgi:23S rRNA (uracil1939-C5)-methyltransferase
MADLSHPRAPRPQLELEIESLAYEGAAVARADGRVIFVDGGAPGDRVLAEIVSERKNLAQARVLAILRPSPCRVEAPCAIADRCGGCDWQHVDYETQLQAKRRIVVDALERNAKIREPVVAPVLRATHCELILILS